MLIPSSCLYSSWYYTHKKKPVERGCVLTEIKDHGRFKGSRVRKARPIKRTFNGIRFTQAKALKVDNDVTGMSTSGNGEKNVEEKEEEDEAKSASLLKLTENVGIDLETCQESTPENHCVMDSKTVPTDCPETENHCVMDSKRYIQTVQKLQIAPCLQKLACPVCLRKKIHFTFQRNW